MLQTKPADAIDMLASFPADKMADMTSRYQEVYQVLLFFLCVCIMTCSHENGSSTEKLGFDRVAFLRMKRFIQNYSHAKYDFYADISLSVTIFFVCRTMQSA